MTVSSAFMMIKVEAAFLLSTLPVQLTKWLPALGMATRYFLSPGCANMPVGGLVVPLPLTWIVKV
jgi:hypothetical protein